MRSRELDVSRNRIREWVGCLGSSARSINEIHVETYCALYSRCLWNKFLCLKYGDNDQTSLAVSVRDIAKGNIGFTKEDVHHDQRVTSSSGHERVQDGTYRKQRDVGDIC